MSRYTIVMCVCTLGAIASMPVIAGAQLFNPGARRNIGTYTQRYLYTRPTVSPYLNLLQRDPTYGLPLYHTQVRPRLEARAQARQQQRSINQVQRQVSNLSTQVRQRNQTTGFQTGHPTRFMTYSHFYPGFNN